MMQEQRPVPSVKVFAGANCVSGLCLQMENLYLFISIFSVWDKKQDVRVTARVVLLTTEVNIC